jgi:nucleoside-diphosphate-sugar epimerase
MRVFVAGATGAIGRPLIKQLLEEGHEVTGMVRNDEGAHRLQQQGAKAEFADALDANAVDTALARTQSEVVINQLTALPKQYSPSTMRDATPGDLRLRKDGGTNLQTAAKARGVRRYILQSSAFWYEPGDGLADESSGFAVDASPYIAAGSRFYRDLEQNAHSMGAPELVVLRYGFLYGPHTWYARDGSVADQVRNKQFPIVEDGRAVWSWVHVEDAAAAAVLSLSRGDSGTYNIVDNNPLQMSVWLPSYARWLDAPPPGRVSAREANDEDAVYDAMRLRGASNAKAKRELGFQPRPLEWLGRSEGKEKGHAA